MLCFREQRMGARQYLVQWTGYDADQDIWEPMQRAKCSGGVHLLTLPPNAFLLSYAWCAAKLFDFSTYNI